MSGNFFSSSVMLLQNKEQCLSLPIFQASLIFDS
jgi:hypothetical protein